MQLFKLKGWVQYKTDVAQPVDRVQIATDAQTAVNEYVNKLGSGYRAALQAELLTGHNYQFSEIGPAA